MRSEFENYSIKKLKGPLKNNKMKNMTHFYCHVLRYE